MKVAALTGFLALIVIPNIEATVRLPQILSSHAVLQRDRPIHIWGWADPEEKITVTFGGTTAAAVADHLGHWTTSLPPRSAGGPFELVVNGSNTIKLDDLLIGDVWFASGQSNMEMPLNGFPGSAVVQNAAEEIRNATHPEMRLLVIPKHASPYPLEDFADHIAWTTCTPETAAKFSAVAYFFGREIASTRHVPVGLVDSTWGGTPAEAWTSLDGLTSDSSLMPSFAAFSKMMKGQTHLDESKRADARDDEAAQKANRPASKHTWRGDLSSWTPGWLFNAMVSPAIDYAIKGVIWYQGESNTDPQRAPHYYRLFPAMITDWRTHWGLGDFPFLFVQISSFNAGGDSQWPTVREAQRLSLRLTNTAMAVTIDVGDPDNVHPANKQAVGSRLALGARALAYGENVRYSGPLYQSATPEDNRLRITFSGFDGSLQSKTENLKGFEIAGADHHFAPADARIEGASVVVSSAAVVHPQYVRYGWQSVPVLSLFDNNGLPAPPFTSEDLRLLGNE